jgi:cell division septation protein DedD
LPRNDDGEFELVLGNRQLISVFLIIVILLGVFFSMGYIVGRNSGPAVTADAGNSAAGKPIVVDHPPPDVSPAPSAAASSEPPPRVDEGKPSPSPKPTSTHPVETAETKPPAVAPPPAASVREPKPAEPATRALPTEPGPGEYWQVVATSRPDAEIVTEALAKKGFKAILAPAPKEGLYRVLVGPLTGAANMADTRVKLEAAGFKNPMMRKY